jgi:integrase/recombinase XerD
MNFHALVPHEQPSVPSADASFFPDSPNMLERNPARAYLATLESDKSQATMASFLNNIARLAGARDLDNFSWKTMRVHDVERVKQILKSTGKAPSTINTYLAALRGVAREAWKLKLIDTESYQLIKEVRNPKGYRLPSGRALEKDEMVRLLLACESEQSSMGIRDAAIFGVMLGCGLRRSEVINLDHASYDRRRRSLRFIAKGAKERQTYLPETSFRRLETWVDEVRGDHPGPLFTRIRRFDDVTDDRLTSQAIYHILTIRSEQAGIGKCAPHDLRRTFATAMLNNNEDLLTVRDAMGHANVNTTAKYDMRGDERLRAASQRLDI